MEKIFQSTKESTLEIQLISNENETLKFQDNVFFVTDLYNLNINTKAVTSKISEYISESFMLDESTEIEKNIHDIEEIVLDKLSDLSFEVTIKNEIEIPDIVKLFGIKINTEEYVNILNRLELLISILARFTEVKILIIANLKNILNNEQIIEFYKSNKEDVEFICLNYGVKITDEEFEKAKAFVLCFPEYYCEEYEDIENEYSECESCHSKEKTNSLFYAQPKGYIKKHENDYGFAGLDGTGELLLLPKLVEKLKKSGVDKKYFQPIISKSKKILGYTFITDNILPQKSYIDENYKFENQCEKCERINMTENENIFYFIPKRITEEGIKNLKDVNKTYEFYDEYREIIISKKVAQIIKENVPYAKFYPVILDNRN